MWTIPVHPAISEHRTALDRAERAITLAKAIRQELAAELAAERRERRPTLIGVAPPTNMNQQRAAYVAAALGMKPSGRY